MNALSRLRQGEAVFGLFLTHPDPGTAETALWCGFDFLVIDCEHGVVDEPAQLNVLRVVSNSQAFSLVRVRANDESAVSRYLDFGADGVMVPDIRSVEQARRFAFAARKRWTVGLRKDRYGLSAEGSSRAEPLLLPLIESAQSVDQIEEIVGIEGVDGIIVGNGDLSTSLGVPGDFAAPTFV